MNYYIIVETIFNKEYKLAIESHRFVGTTMYMLLADRFYIGINDKLSYENKFASYEEAELMVQMLQSYKEK